MEVVQDLTCPICLEFYTYPIILPCSHVLCRRPCAENIFEVNFIRCPVCRDNCYITGGITSLPRVIPLESIIEKVRAERKKRAGYRKAAISTSSTDVSSDSAPNTGRDGSFQGETVTPSTLSAISPTSGQRSERSASLQIQQGADHSTSRQNHQALRGASLACDELLDDYQRIMRSLDNPPHVASFLRNRNQNYPTTNPQHSSPSYTATCSDTPSEPIIASASSNRLDESPFSATPTNDVTSESTLTLDHEIEDILGTPGFRTSNLHVFSPSQSTPRAPHQASGSAVSTMLCLPNSTSSSQQENMVNHSTSTTDHTMEPNDSQETSLLTSDLNVSTTANGIIESPEILILKHEIQEELSRLSDVQCRLLLYLTSYRDSAQRVQGFLHQDGCDVTTELDSLLAEIETRRNFLDQGVRGAQRDVITEADDVTAATEKLLASTQRLASFADRALAESPEVLQQTGPAVLEK
ncbi:E3 ubiquitin-protein ligase Midline-1-like [Elysia marginata]|uniref:E3 ubiquitin-protein ligase Midline-1-like n=1 Tax=Elysia marginata TaxID=1093978 RepID=A0AAV4GEE2_9GAST|nr:E3 ubiquitin-protein ligase Midline-1-like [Elysia marginata]